MGNGRQRAGIVEAVAAARDEALIEMGRAAAARQDERVEREPPRRGNGGMVIAAVAAGAAIAAGAVAYQARKRRNGQDGKGTMGMGRSERGNGIVSEHEHDEAQGAGMTQGGRTQREGMTKDQDDAMAMASTLQNDGSEFKEAGNDGIQEDQGQGSRGRRHRAR